MWRDEYGFDPASLARLLETPPVVDQGGLTYERGETGKIPHWRGIYDKRRRLVAVFCHNMDLGDAWEWSDDPRYPEKWASLAYRIGVNYLIYDMTH